jgi:hippurate hydrolase
VSLDEAVLDWSAAAEAEQEATIALRRAIHADPELGLNCSRTTEKLKESLPACR